MFFVLSKTLALLFLPSNFLILLGLAGVALMLTRRKGAGAFVAALSIVLLTAASVLPLGDLLGRALEDRFPEWDASRGAPTALWCWEEQLRLAFRRSVASRSMATVARVLLRWRR